MSESTEKNRRKSLHSIVQHYNIKGMKKLRKNQVRQALELLMIPYKLLQNLTPKTELWGATLNNIGCCYKKLKQYTTALHYFQRAVSDGSDMEKINLAGAYLNMCVIKSEQKNHQAAAQLARKILDLTAKTLGNDKKLTEISVLACQQLGVQYYFLKNNKKALFYLVKGRQIAQQCQAPQQTLILFSRFIQKVRKEANLGRNLQTDRFFRDKDSNFLFPSQEKKMNHSSENHLKFQYGEHLQPLSPVKTPKRILFKRKRLPSLSYQSESVESSFKPIVQRVEIGVQVDKDPFPRGVRDKAAAVIQKYWKGFETRKMYKIMYCNSKIKQAKMKAQRALKELDYFRKQKMRLNQQKPVQTQRILRPILFRAKTDSGFFQ